MLSIPAAHAGQLDTYTLLPQRVTELDHVFLRVDSDACLVLDYGADVKREGNVVHIELDQDDQCFANLGHQTRLYPIGALPPGSYVLSIDHCSDFSFPPPGQEPCYQAASIPFQVLSFAEARHRIPAWSRTAAYLTAACMLLAGCVMLRRA